MTFEEYAEQKYDKGVEAGRVEGEAKGRAEGLAEGIAKGKKEALDDLVKRGLITAEQASELY